MPEVLALSALFFHKFQLVSGCYLSFAFVLPRAKAGAKTRAKRSGPHIIVPVTFTSPSI